MQTIHNDNHKRFNEEMEIGNSIDEKIDKNFGSLEPIMKQIEKKILQYHYEKMKTN